MQLTQPTRKERYGQMKRRRIISKTDVPVLLGRLLTRICALSGSMLVQLAVGVSCWSLQVQPSVFCRFIFHINIVRHRTSQGADVFGLFSLLTPLLHLISTCHNVSPPPSPTPLPRIPSIPLCLSVMQPCNLCSRGKSSTIHHDFCPSPVGSVTLLCIY